MFARIAIMVGVAVFVWSALVRPAGSHGPKQVYVVAPYETLWSIASSRYAGDTRDAIYRIQQANHLGTGTIHVGQRLVLP
jgi:LysM repeat protein